MGCFILASFSSPRCASAQTQKNGSRPAQSPVTAAAEATRVEHAPKLDGTLDDPVWQSAKAVVEFRQQEPNEGETATEKTEVRILYTRHAVYFGIHCYDSEPGKIVATELRRDVSQDLDDHFEILIDSNHDRRGAYVFQINPLGTQLDGVIVEEQGMGEGTDFDSGWDGAWISEARITADGWTATVEVPLTTLNFTQSQNVIWGLNFKRFIRGKNEEDLWSAYRRTFGITRVSQAGELTGITDIGTGRLFVVKPYGLLQYDKQDNQNAKFPLTGGLDLKYGLRSNLVLNLTGNTDFADTDVDQVQFNLTPFKIPGWKESRRKGKLGRISIPSWDSLSAPIRIKNTVTRHSRCGRGSRVSANCNSRGSFFRHPTREPWCKRRNSKGRSARNCHL